MCGIPSFTAPYPTLHPTQLIIMAQYPTNNQPPSPTHTQNCTQIPQEAATQMNSLLCLQNTWQPPPRKERRVFWSLINTWANYWLKITIPISRKKTAQFWAHQILNGPTHVGRVTLSTHQRHYPSVPMTRTHPNPHQAPPTVNLFDP